MENYFSYLAERGVQGNYNLRFIISKLNFHLFQGSRFIDLIKQYRAKIEKELEDICNDVLRLLDDPLIPNSKNAEARVFFMKMKGDYFRYLGEFLTGDKRKNIIQQA